jgi:serine/threonine protein kinase
MSTTAGGQAGSVALPKSAAAGAPAALEDPRVIEVMEEYQSALEAGRVPNRQELLNRYPDLACVLGECLAALAFVHRLAPGMQGPAEGQADSAPPGADDIRREGPLGDFRIVREVGRGGMGVVYEAQQLSLDRRVALKVLPFAAALDAKQLARFKNEAQAAAGLHHTNIVPVFSVGCERGLHFYAMQFIDGQTLAALIADLRRPAGLGGQDAGLSGPEPSPGEAAATLPAALVTERSAVAPGYFRLAARLGIQAAEALEHAHQMGVVHRDVKPANLMVDTRGNLWVTDFGLAQFHSDAGLTRSGDLVGTLRYMSPEQAGGKHAVVDQRTDVYSLGATLYELLTLEPAFAASDRYELLTQIAFREPRPPRRLNKAVPAELETIVLKATEKSAEDRYASAQELADDLRRFLEDRPIRAKRPSVVQRARKWAQRHRSLVAAAVVAMVFMTAAALLSSLLVWRQAKETEAALQAEAQQRREAEAARQAVAEQLRLVKAQRRFALLSGDLSALVVERAGHNQIHLTAGERKFLEWVLEQYQQELSADQSTDPLSQSETARAYIQVGYIWKMLGQPAKAEAAYTRAIALLGPLADESSPEPWSQYALAKSLNGLGSLLASTGRRRKAEKLLRRALALYEQLHKELANGPSQELLGALVHAGLPHAPERPSHGAPVRKGRLVIVALRIIRHDLADNHHNLGVALAGSGRPVEAERCCDRAAALYEKLAAERPKDLACREKLASCHYVRGELLRTAGRLPQAAEAYYRAVALYEKLVAEGPNNRAFRWGLAKALKSLGVVLAEDRQLQRSEKALRQALALTQKLAEGSPSWGAYRYGLALTHGNLGLVLQATGRLPQAEKELRQALALLEKLAADAPGEIEYRHQLARACFNLGSLLEITRRPREAERPLRQARAIYEKFPAGARLDVRAELAGTLNALALVLKKTGRPAAAGKAYWQAVALWGKLAEEFPKERKCRISLAGTLHNLAWLLSSQGEHAKARPLVEQAIRHQKAVLGQGPEDPADRQLLQSHYLVLAEALLGLRKHGEAARTAEEVVRISPERWHALRSAADILGDCVLLAEKDDCLSPQERQAKVRAYTERIRALLRELERQAADDTAARNALARFLALCPLPGVAGPDRAVTLAKQAVERSLKNGNYWTTLGLALYRAGKWQKAATTLDLARKLPGGDSALNGLFLAMAHARLGEQDKAAHWWRRATDGMDKNQPPSRDLRRIRAEAAPLLKRSE